MLSPAELLCVHPLSDWDYNLGLSSPHESLVPCTEDICGPILLFLSVLSQWTSVHSTTEIQAPKAIPWEVFLIAWYIQGMDVPGNEG